MAAIELKNVAKRYNKLQVVHGLDLQIPAGSFAVILGPSGCGKSTLLRMIAGLEEITSGDVSIGGRRVNALEPRERGCAMVFQTYALYPHMTVGENIGYALKVAGIGRAERAARVQAAAALLGLEEMLARKPGQLSGGQRQRVAMGRAMIREPKVFLYDEPLSNLDAKLRVAMRIEIRRLHNRLGATSVFVTHDQAEAMALADCIVVMNKGRIEQAGTPREIYNRPASVWVAGFIGTPGMGFAKGRVDAASGRIVLGDNQEIALDSARYAGIADGPVIAGMRAENVRVSVPGKGLRARFEFGEELGASQLLHCGLGGEMIAAHGRDGIIRTAGDEIWLAVEPGDVHLFDAETGKRLAEAGAAGGFGITSGHLAVA